MIQDQAQPEFSGFQAKSRLAMKHWELPYHPDARDSKSEPSEGSCNCAFRGGATTDFMVFYRNALQWRMRHPKDIAPTLNK
jgi:hypothetical protein